MKGENVRVVVMLTLAFVLGFKSIALYLQHSFKLATLLFLLTWTCICYTFPDNLLGASIEQDLKEVIEKWVKRRKLRKKWSKY